MESLKWDAKHLNIAILATDGKSFRKVAWLTTRSGGIYCGIGSTVGVATKLSYHTNGDLYSGMVSKIPNLPSNPKSKLKYPPITNIKGLVPFYAVGLGWHEYFPAFPFKKIDDAVYVDVRGKGGMSFNLGLLEPFAYGALAAIISTPTPVLGSNGFRLESGNVFKDAHVHIITKTKPWIVIWTY